MSSHAKTPRRRRLSGDQGFSMYAVMLILLTSGLFVLAGYAAANGDLPLSGRVADRKTTFAAAEAGVNFYQFHLNQDNDYWLKCTNVSKPNATENSPINQEWASQTGTDPRNWRTIPGSSAQYTIELLPAPGKSSCVQGDGKSMLDPVSNVFRIRVTGRPTATSKVRRSIIATFRRTGFLDFLYYTNYEDLDPSAYSSSSDRANANLYCADKPRAQRNVWPCAEITFANQDAINGPLHTNDIPQMCGSPTFGRGPQDRVTVFGAAPGWITSAGCGSATPNFKSPLRTVTKSVDMPSSNDELKNIVQSSYHYYGRTTILFQASTPGKMTVTNSKVNAGVPLLVDVPSNGLVYVDNDPGGSCTQQVPTAQTYTWSTYSESTACGNLYVSGTYDTSMTLAAANDIVIKPNDTNCTGTCNGSLIHSNDAVMGLVANQFIRVYHPCSSGANQKGYMTAVTVDAAILSLKHSFIADNYNCGGALGKLTVNGAIAQKYRGAVGTFNGVSTASGYTKDYWYDDRLKYRTPPFFLQPTSSAWNVIRFNEQLKPR